MAFKAMCLAEFYNLNTSKLTVNDYFFDYCFIIDQSNEKLKICIWS